MRHRPASDILKTRIKTVAVGFPRFYILAWLALVVCCCVAGPSSAFAYGAKVSIVAVGDVNLGERIATISRSRPEGVDYPFVNVRQITGESDISFCNLECCLSETGAPAQKRFTFRGPSAAAEALARAGFDVVSLANNHVLDYGTRAMDDTLGALERARVGFAGAGRNRAAAVSPFVIERNGLRIAFFAFSDIVPAGWTAGDNSPGIASMRPLETMLTTVSSYSGTADVVIVSLHWGIERTASPHPRQREAAKALIDAGATVVLGHHPHVVQGFEAYRHGIIAYSLGNFIFTPGNPPAGAETLILRLELDRWGLREAEIHPAIIVNAQAQLADGEYGERLQQTYADRSAALGTTWEHDGKRLVYRTHRFRVPGLWRRMVHLEQKY